MKEFKPSQDQIRMAETLFTAMAHESLIRPIVEKYEQEILDKHQFRIAPRWVEKGLTDRVITDRKHAYLMSEEDANIFYAECFAARDAANLKVEDPESCPLLVAEHLRIDAENALLEAISTIPGLEKFGRGVMTIEQRKMAIDITLKLLAPYCGSGDDIMRRIVGEPPKTTGGAL